MLKKIILSFLFLASTLAHADSFTPSNFCSAPSKPYRFTSEREVQQYKSDVERYKRCIEDFVNDQERAINNHQKAANDAIDDWNRFVNQMSW